MELAASKNALLESLVPPAKKRKRSHNFDFKDMEVLVKLVSSLDPEKIITYASKDAGILAKKKNIWGQDNRSIILIISPNIYLSQALYSLVLPGETSSVTALQLQCSVRKSSARHQRSTFWVAEAGQDESQRVRGTRRPKSITKTFAQKSSSCSVSSRSRWGRF